MLLSRAADALYWISRYLERAEHTARFMGVAADIGPGRDRGADERAGPRLYAALGLRPAGAVSLVDAALFDATSRSSAFTCISAARDNARQVREEISSEMWEQLNALFLRLRQLREDGARAARPHAVARTVIEGVHLFQGITDATMGHGEGWQYLQVGRFLERAGATAALLDAFLVQDSDAAVLASLDQVEWVALLRSCSALEAYCRHYTADVRPERIAEFLLLNAEFPRSVRFAAGRVESALLALGRYAGRGSGGRVERLAGRLHAMLDYGQLDEILSENPHAFLEGIGRQCGAIHLALHQSYVSYPIDSALPA